jgi:hypothetical protein
MDKSLFAALQSEFGEKLTKIRVGVNDVKLKMGNAISVIPLA